MLKNIIDNKNILFSYKPEDRSIQAKDLHVVAVSGYALIYGWESPDESNFKSALKKFKYSKVVTS